MGNENLSETIRRIRENGVRIPYFEALDHLDIANLEPPRWVVEGMIPENGAVFLVAESGAGKSTLAAQICAHVAAGRDVLGFRVPRARRVSIWPGEGNRQHILKRLASMLKACDLDDGRANIYFPSSLIPESFVSDEFVAPIFMDKPELVVIDTFNLSFNENENDNSAVANFAARPLKVISERLGCSFLILAHYGKVSPFSDANSTRDLRGASALRGFADAIIHLDKVKGHLDERMLVCSKQRSGPEFPSVRLRIDLESAVFERLGDATEEKAQKDRQKLEAIGDKILALLEKSPGLTGREVTEKLSLSPNVASSARKDLESRGLARKENGPNNSEKWFAVTLE